MVSPEELDTQVTLRTAVARYEQLRALESLVDESLETEHALAALGGALSQGQALELLALSEVSSARPPTVASSPCVRRVGRGLPSRLSARRWARASRPPGRRTPDGLTTKVSNTRPPVTRA